MGAALAVGVLLWVALGDEQAPTRAEPKTAALADGGGGARADGARGRESPEKASRSLEVLVEGCRGPAPDTLVFVKTGEALSSGRTDPTGRARLAIAPGPAMVSARVGGHEASAVAGADHSTVVVKACRAGVVKGVVFGVHGAARGMVGISLVGGDGLVIDEVESDIDGRFRLVDPDLAAVAVRVDPSRLGTMEEVWDAPTDLSIFEIPVARLMPGEERQLDVVLGASMELVGWVVDPQGEPMSGVLVSVGVEDFPASWRAVTDKGGAFRFSRMPNHGLRVTADGGDLGLSSQRVLPLSGDETRREVTLVLEPTGTVVVYMAPGIRGEVVVRSYSPGAHGPDPLRAGAMYEDMGDVVGSGEGEGEGEELSSDGGAIGLDHDEQMKALDEAFVEVLREFSVDDPVGGLARMVEGMIGTQPLVEPMFREEAERMVPGSRDLPIGELARRMAEKAIAEEPMLPEIMARAAEMVRDGDSGFEAIMRASEEHRRETLGLTDGANAEPSDTEPEPDVLGEHVEMIDGDEVAAIPSSDDLYEPLSVFDEDLEAMREKLGVPFIEYETMSRESEVARGRIGQEIAVRGSMRYEIFALIDAPDAVARFEVSCGEVLVPTGRTVEVYCGKKTETTLVGRVVDTQGRGVEGAMVSVQGEDSHLVETLTDARGGYVVSFELSRAFPCRMNVTREVAGEVWRPSERLNLACAPAHTVEVDPIVLRREDEAPVHRPFEPFGGVGGALSWGFDGVVLSMIREDGPLAMDGVEEGSTILRVDDEEATTWSVEEMLARLRGDVGSNVMLRLRSPEGELVETVIERGLITP